MSRSGQILASELILPKNGTIYIGNCPIKCSYNNISIENIDVKKLYINGQIISNGSGNVITDTFGKKNELLVYDANGSKYVKGSGLIFENGAISTSSNFILNSPSVSLNSNTNIMLNSKNTNSITIDDNTIIKSINDILLESNSVNMKTNIINKTSNKYTNTNAEYNLLSNLVNIKSDIFNYEGTTLNLTYDNNTVRSSIIDIQTNKYKLHSIDELDILSDNNIKLASDELVIVNNTITINTDNINYGVNDNYKIDSKKMLMNITNNLQLNFGIGTITSQTDLNVNSKKIKIINDETVIKSLIFNGLFTDFNIKSNVNLDSNNIILKTTNYTNTSSLYTLNTSNYNIITNSSSILNNNGNMSLATLNGNLNISVSENLLIDAKKIKLLTSDCLIKNDNSKINIDSNIIIESSNLIFTSNNILELKSNGILDINSSGGIINIGDNDDNFGINIGTNGIRNIIIGSNESTLDLNFNEFYINDKPFIKNNNIKLDSLNNFDLSAQGSFNISSINSSVKINNKIVCNSPEIKLQGNLLNINNSNINVTSDNLTINTKLLSMNSEGDINIGTNNVDSHVNIGTNGIRDIYIGSSKTPLFNIYGNEINVESNKNITLKLESNINNNTNIDIISNNSIGTGNINLHSNNVNIDSSLNIQNQNIFRRSSGRYYLEEFFEILPSRTTNLIPTGKTNQLRIEYNTSYSGIQLTTLSTNNDYINLYPNSDHAFGKLNWNTNKNYELECAVVIPEVLTANIIIGLKSTKNDNDKNQLIISNNQNNTWFINETIGNVSIINNLPVLTNLCRIRFTFNSNKKANIYINDSLYRTSNIFDDIKLLPFIGLTNTSNISNSLTVCYVKLNMLL